MAEHPFSSPLFRFVESGNVFFSAHRNRCLYRSKKAARCLSTINDFLFIIKWFYLFYFRVSSPVSLCVCVKYRK